MQSQNHKYAFLKASIIVGLAVILSRVLGLIREQYSLYLFGAGWNLDAYISAYKIPNFMRNMLGEGAFSVVFTSIFSVLYQRNKEKAEIFTRRILSYLIVISFIVASMAIVFTPYYMSFIHRSSENFHLVVHLSRIMIFFIHFISIAAIFMGILNSWGRYFIPAFAPSVGNICNILLIYFLHPYFGIDTLAIGYLMNSVILMSFQIPFIFNKNFKFRFDFTFDFRIKKFFKSFFPVAFGMAFFQINQLLSNIFSSKIEGGNSIIDKSFLIIQMAIAILSTGISVVLLPMMSGSKTKHNKHIVFNDSIRAIFLIITPVMIMFILLSYDISSFVFKDSLQLFGFGLGKINEDTIKKIGTCISYFAPGILIYSLITVVTRSLQGLHKYYLPLCGSLFSTCLNVAIMTLGFDKYHINLLPISLNISAICDLLILTILIKWQFKNRLNDQLGLFFIKNIIAGGILYWILTQIMIPLQILQNVIRLPLILIMGIILYFILLYCLKEEISTNIINKLFKKWKHRS